MNNLYRIGFENIQLMSSYINLITKRSSRLNLYSNLVVIEDASKDEKDVEQKTGSYMNNSNFYIRYQGSLHA